MQIIAEVKTMSPFGFSSPHTWDELLEIAVDVGHIISVHTDPRWGGSLQHVTRARVLVPNHIPILAKGIHATDGEIEDAFEAGANYVLVVGRRPHTVKRVADCMIEAICAEQLRVLPKDTMAVWNQRNIRNGKPKGTTFAEARELFPGWLCQASFIQTMDDVQQGANAALVGACLPEFAKTLVES